MFTAAQYRAKAVEYAALLKTAQSPSETRELQDLERTYKSLAENAEWMANNVDKTLSASSETLNNRSALTAEEEQILGRLGAAVIMRWGTLPTKIQRELFECAASIEGVQQTARIKGQIARFLHNHKDDGRTTATAFAVASSKDQLSLPKIPSGNRFLGEGESVHHSM